MMATTIEAHVPLDLASADLTPRGPVHPSPVAWRDQVIYFLLPDRFSDAGEPGRPMFDRSRPEAFRAADKAAWMRGGKDFQGGTLRGIASKLDYLKALGVTCLWIGPVWRQRAELDTYHGYGIQNFLDVDPRFGTRQDLRDLVDAAHARGIYVLLDAIYNHTGNNWFYDEDGNARTTRPYRYQPPYPVHGWRSASGGSVATVAELETGVWPREFQNLDWYTRAGQIDRWDPESWEDPAHPSNPFRRGDFFDLKDLKLNELEPPAQEVLSALARAYQYWIALCDCDGFRIDTVKHVSRDASRHFCGAIREYAESIGKESFLLLGEVTGGSAMARDYLEIFGRNLDAVLDIGEPAERLAGFTKGFTEPRAYFAQFGGHDSIGSHRETGRYHVSILDDHDMVGRPGKHRFASPRTGPNRHLQVAHAIGVLLTTLGIPCIYYGTEQAFDGTEDRHDDQIEPRNRDGSVPFADRYIREAMFGGSFGAMETAGCHFFDRDHPTYLRIAAIAGARSRSDRTGLALRRGRQYLRETSIEGAPFRIPPAGELVGWSRILFDAEALVLLNTHGALPRGAAVTVDASLHADHSRMRVLYHSAWSDDELRNPPDQTIPVRKSDGRATVTIELPPAGMAILG
jgi:glycosidase